MFDLWYLYFLYYLKKKKSVQWRSPNKWVWQKVFIFFNEITSNVYYWVAVKIIRSKSIWKALHHLMSMVYRCLSFIISTSNIFFFVTIVENSPCLEIFRKTHTHTHTNKTENDRKYQLIKLCKIDTHNFTFSLPTRKKSINL